MNKKLKGISPKLGNKVGNRVLKEKIDKQIKEFCKLKDELQKLWVNGLYNNKDNLLEIMSLEAMISVKIDKMLLLKYFVDRIHLITKDNKIKYPKYKFARYNSKHLNKKLVYLKNKMERIKDDK